MKLINPWKVVEEYERKTLEAYERILKGLQKQKGENMRNPKNKNFAKSSQDDKPRKQTEQNPKGEKLGR